MKSNDLTRLGLGLWLAAATGIAACTEQIPTAIKDCPCADGSVCCDSGVCAATQDACGAATVALSKSVEGRWVGHIEGFEQVSTDDALAISISVAADGTLSGQVVIGSATTPPPATNGDLPWPNPETPWEKPYPGNGSLDTLLGVEWPFPDPLGTLYVSGFPYTARGIRWEDRRLRFGYATYEPWQPWCALQQPVASDQHPYDCVPTFAGLTDPEANCFARTTPLTPVPCMKYRYCGQGDVCACDANGCFANIDTCNNDVCPSGGHSAAFDITIRGDVADGTAYIPYHGNNTIRLTRVGH